MMRMSVLWLSVVLVSLAIAAPVPEKKPPSEVAVVSMPPGHLAEPAEVKITSMPAMRAPEVKVVLPPDEPRVTWPTRLGACWRQRWFWPLRQ